MMNDDKLFEAGEQLAQALRHMVEYVRDEPPVWDPVLLLEEAQAAAAAWFAATAESGDEPGWQPDNQRQWVEDTTEAGLS